MKIKQETWDKMVLIGMAATFLTFGVDKASIKIPEILGWVWIVVGIGYFVLALIYARE